MTTSSARPLAELIDDLQTGFACGEKAADGVIQLRMNNVDTEGHIDLGTPRRVPRSLADLDRFGLRADDVMFNNTNSPELVGKSAVFGGHQEPVVFSNHFTRVRVKPRALEPRFLARWLNWQWKQGRFALLCNQWVNQASVRKEALLALEVPTPPLPEQRRIADILDKADAVRRKRKEAIALTEELLRSAFLEMFGDPVTNPKGWPVKALGQAVDRFEAGWSANGEARERAGDEYGVLKVSAVTSGYFRPQEHKAVAATDVDRELVTPRRGDLLFSRANTRELVAACCLVEQDEPRLFLPDKLWRIVADGRLATPEYLKFLLGHGRFRGEFTKRATGTSGSMLNISMEKVRSMEMPVPPIVLQKRFSVLVWQTYQVRERFADARGASDDLFGTLVQLAFRGELTASVGKRQLGMSEAAG